jgi:membrane protease YdiL (CAAX protease family)
VDDWREQLLTLDAYLLIAGPGLVALLAWRLLSPRRPLLPAVQRVRPLTWGGLDVFMAFMVVQLVPAVVYGALRKLGVLEWLYGAEGDKATEARGILLATDVGAAVAFGLIVVMLWYARRVRPAEYGLTVVRAGPNLAAGFLVWLAVTPLSLGLYAILEWLLGPGGIEKHPAEDVIRAGLLPGEWIVMGLGLVVVAPLLEELSFRGLLLPWQLRRGWEAQVTVAFCALLFATIEGARTGPSDEEIGFNGWPALFVLLMLPGVVLLPNWLLRHVPPEPEPAGLLGPPEEDEESDEPPLPLPGWVRALRPALDRRAQPALAIYTNGLFFAAVHSRVWPSPVPLFLLGLALAWVRYRTSSLVPAVLLHALFNAVSVLALTLDFWI